MQFLCPSATCAPPGGARTERLSPWGKQKLYAASAHARDRRLGGQAKRSWAVKSRECCEPSDACLLRVGGAPPTSTEPIPFGSFSLNRWRQRRLAEKGSVDRKSVG